MSRDGEKRRQDAQRNRDAAGERRKTRMTTERTSGPRNGKRTR